MWNVTRRIFGEVLTPKFFWTILKSFGVLALFALVSQIISATLKNVGKDLKDSIVQAYNAATYIYKNKD